MNPVRFIACGCNHHIVRNPIGQQRILLRIGSANYAAKAWVDGQIVAQHDGGHLPFVADVTKLLQWERPNRIVFAVENKQLLDRVPPGPGEAGGGVAGVLGGFPLTTYDISPYAGLHRPVQLYTVPSRAHVDDVIVVTTIDGSDGVVDVEVLAAGNYARKGRVALHDSETNLEFADGVARTSIHLQDARLWSPDDPYLYSLRVTLSEGDEVTDSYSLEAGIRTIAVRGEQRIFHARSAAQNGAHFLRTHWSGTNMIPFAFDIPDYAELCGAIAPCEHSCIGMPPPVYKSVESFAHDARRINLRNLSTH